MSGIVTVQVRRGTAAQWAAANPVLAAGESALETDTGVEKIGDGVTAYSALAMRQSATYAPLSGASIVGLGDSITAGGSSTANMVAADSHFTYLVASLAGRAQYINNAGIGGNKTADMVARLTADVIALAPQKCLIEAGTNDTDPIAQTLPNLTTILAALRGAKIEPLLATIPPAGTAAIAAPAPVATASTSGGTLAAATYSYRVSAINGVGETLAATAVTGTVASGSTGSVLLSWSQVLGATGYKIYGRTGGSELLIATASSGGHPITQYTDTGSVTPAGALPGSNTTVVALSPTVRTKITGVNGVIHRLAEKYCIPLVDYYLLLVDGSTGLYKTGYTTDGTHPSFIASKLMGQLAASKLAERFPPRTPYLAGDNADPTNMLANGLMLTGSATLPTSWSASGNTATAVTALAADPAIAGNALTITRTGVAGHYLVAPQITTGFSVGDLINFSFMVKLVGADLGAGNLAVKLKAVNSTGSANIGDLEITSDVTGWTPFEFINTVPPGTTALELDINTAYGPLTAAVAQITVRNLTTGGIA